MHLDKILLVKEKLQKMLDAKFIDAIAYPEWVFNLVIVFKLDGRIRIYIDFKYVNKSYPKDYFPLPNIETLVENTMGHEMFSLMNGFSSYNQIMNAKEGKHKMTSITPCGIYCYKVILFGFNNEKEMY